MMLLVVGFFITSVWGCSFECGGCMDGSRMGVCKRRSGGGFNCMSSRSYLSACASVVPGRAVVPARSASECTGECRSCGGELDSGVCISKARFVAGGVGFNCMSGSSYKRRCSAIVPSRAANGCTRECFACRDGGSFGVCIPSVNGFNCMSGSSYKNRCRAMVPSREMGGSLVAPARFTNQCTFLCSPCRDGSQAGVCIEAGNSFNCYSSKSYKNQCASVVPSGRVNYEERSVDVEGFGQYDKLIIGAAVASAFWLTIAVIWKLSAKKLQYEYVEA